MTQTKPRRSTSLPVTTMEDVPVLDDGERERLLADLRQAEADTASRSGIDHDSKRFRDRLTRIYRGKQR